MSASAQESVMSIAEWQVADSVFCYLALRGEVGTDILVRACHESGRRIFVPAFRVETGRYEPALYEGGELIAGYGGVPEPARPEWLMPVSAGAACASAAGKAGVIALAIVPGVAFDRSGNRIGHGRGHYDRIFGLAALKNSFKIGLAFEFQLFDAVPSDIHDVRMDAVVTESNVYTFST